MPATERTALINDAVPSWWCRDSLWCPISITSFAAKFTLSAYAPEWSSCNVIFLLVFSIYYYFASSLRSLIEDRKFGSVLFLEYPITSSIVFSPAIRKCFLSNNYNEVENHTLGFQFIINSFVLHHLKAIYKLRSISINHQLWSCHLHHKFGFHFILFYKFHHHPQAPEADTAVPAYVWLVAMSAVIGGSFQFGYVLCRDITIFSSGSLSMFTFY